MDICSALTKTERAKIARELVQLLQELTAVSHDLCREINLGCRTECVRKGSLFKSAILMQHTLLLTPTGLMEKAVKGVMNDNTFLEYADTKPLSRNIPSSEFEMVVNAYYLNTTRLREVLNWIKASRGDAA